MMLDRIGSFAFSALASAAPLALAAMGGLATEAAGSLSIALEGYMLIGAFASAACGQASGSLGIGLAAGAASGMLLSLFVASAHRYLRADIFVAGLAANILAPGLAAVISQAVYGTKGVLAAEAIRAGPIGLVVILAFATIALAVQLSRSVFGLRLRAVGEGDEIAKAAGISGGAYRFAAHVLAGASSGLAGATLAAGVGAYVPGMSTGRGWIALVAVFLGARRAGGVMAACLFFGFLFVLANLAQTLGGSESTAKALADATELLQALPYVATALALVLWKRIAGNGREAR
jgi:general nucleoside transport system permease protein